MGRLTPLKIRNLKEPGRYNDGDGLFLELAGPNKGNWQLRATVNGRRRDIGLGSLALVSLKEARDAAFELRRDIQRGIDPVAKRRRRKMEFLILTAARSGEVRGAKWNEIDLEAKLWTIPASRMKVGKEHVVPLHN